MRKRILSIVILSIFLIAGFIYINKVYKEKERYVNSFEDFKILAKKTDIDILFFGSSMAHTAYNPLVINHFTKSISYNLGSDALRIPVSNLIFQESLKYSSPKLIVIEVHESSIKYPKEENIKGLQLAPLDFVSNLSFNKINTINNTYGKNEVLSAMFPLVRNHANWNEYNLFNINKRKEVDTIKYFYFGGHYGLIKTIDESKWEKYRDFRTNPIKKNKDKHLFSIEEKNNFINFINRAKKLNIEVLVVTSPYLLARYGKNSFFDEINKLSDSLNVNNINLNDYYKEIGIKFNDFSDKYHLNEKGSIKTSEFLADYINKNYSIKKRSTDNIWKEIDKLYPKIIDKYAEVEDQVFEKELNLQLNKDLGVKNIRIVKNRIRKDFSIKVNYSENIKNELSNFKMAVYIYPKENDVKLINKKRRDLSKFFDQADIHLKNNSDTINFRINTKIENIKEIKVFLYNAEKYNGIIGSPIIIKDISFK